MKMFSVLSLSVLVLCLQGCYTEHKVETVHEVKPIHITIDLNVKVKVDKELDNFFDDIDEQAEKIGEKEAAK